MGCCIQSHETEINVKHGEIFKYSITAPNAKNCEWILFNFQFAQISQIYALTIKKFK